MRLLRTRDGVVLQLAGEVSAAHGGGFASARTRDADPPWDLTPYDGIRLRLRGDGQRYKCGGALRARACAHLLCIHTFAAHIPSFRLALRDEYGWMAPAWEAPVDTVAGAWSTVRLPWRDFRRGGFGVTWRDGSRVPQLRLRHITSLQILLSKFECAPHAATGGGLVAACMFADLHASSQRRHVAPQRARGRAVPRAAGGGPRPEPLLRGGALRAANPGTEQGVGSARQACHAVC